MKKVTFEKIKAITKEEAKMLNGGYKDHETDSTGDTYFANQNAWQHDGPTATYDAGPK